MPFRSIPETDAEYGLISFDAHGKERQDDPHGLMSERLLERAADSEVSNIFLFTHGWMGDFQAAQDQFDAWIKALHTRTADRERATASLPGSRPLYIGVHWPSLPWGDESVAAASFAAEDAPDLDDQLASYLNWFGDTPGIRRSVTTILEQSRRGDQHSAAVREAFKAIEEELGASGHDDAEGMTIDLNDLGGGAGDAFGGAGGSGLLDTLRLLSFWSMKKRARTIGEGAVHDLLRALQRVTASRQTPIHLMGHSFGCVVISSALRGSGAAATLERPIDSVALVQGAVSLWSYAASIPDDETPGYFCDVVTSRKVRGPLIVTRSKHDLAVRGPYRLASRVSRAADFAAGDFFPRYGAIGCFGLQGLPPEIATDVALRPADEPYGFECGKIYNLEASAFVSKMEGTAGAHSDIAGPEIAHALWEAAIAAARRP